MSLRRIRSQYNGRCKRCNTPHKIGQWIDWSRNTGALCVACGQQSKKPIETPAAIPFDSGAEKKPRRTNGLVSFTLEWSKLKGIMQKVINENDLSFFTERNARAEANESITQGRRHERFYGYSLGQLKRWINEGYSTEAMQGLSEFIPPVREKRRLQFLEEGDEFHIDLAWSGSDTYMSEWTKRDVIPGLAIQVNVSMSAGVPAEILNAYNAWICRAIYSLETAGVDCEIAIAERSRGAFDTGPQRTEHIVILKRENEITDFVSISPMISPAAFRTFMFAAKAINAQESGNRLDFPGQGVGDNESKEWKVDYDSEMRKMHFHCPYHPREFPEENMTNQFREILKQIK